MPLSAAIHNLDEFRMLVLNPVEHAAFLSLRASVPDEYIKVQASQACHGVVCQLQLIDEFCRRVDLECKRRCDDSACIVILAEIRDALID